MVERLRRHALPQQSKAGRTLHQCLVSAGQYARECEADAKGEQGIQRIRRHRKSFRYTANLHCFAKSRGRRHIILKEGLTALAAPVGGAWVAIRSKLVKAYDNSLPHGIFACDSAPLPPRTLIVLRS